MERPFYIKSYFIGFILLNLVYLYFVIFKNFFGTSIIFRILSLIQIIPSSLFAYNFFMLKKTFAQRWLNISYGYMILTTLIYTTALGVSKSSFVPFLDMITNILLITIIWYSFNKYIKTKEYKGKPLFSD